MKRVLIGLLFALGLAMPGWAQGIPYNNVAFTLNNMGEVIPAGGAQIDVCQPTDTGLPCTNHVNIFSDAAMAHPITQPFFADLYGNFNFYAATCGPFVYTVTGATVLPKSYPINPCGNGGAINPSSLNSIIFVDGVTNKTLAAAVTLCPTNCVIYDTLPETFTADPFASATGKNITVNFYPGTWTIASGGTYGMTVPSNVSLMCSSQATTIKVGNNTNYVNDIVLGGYASINTVNNARIDNCTIDGNAANNLGGVTNAVILIAGGFSVGGLAGGNNHLTRNRFLTSPGQFVMISDVNVSGTYYPSVGDEIGENVFQTLNGCGTHCIIVYGHSATGGEYFNSRIHDNSIYGYQGFGIEVRVANGVLVTGNQVTGIICCGGQATVNTTSGSITGCAANGVTFTAGTTANLVGTDTMGSGSQLKINRVNYTVSHVVDGTHVCLSTAPGTQTGVTAYGGSLELIHHDTAAFGLTANNIIDTGSDNCVSFINLTGGQTAQGYGILGNSIRNCGGLGVNLDGTTGSGNISGNMIANNVIQGAGQGGAAEALQFDSGVRLATVKDLNNIITGNWIGDLAASPTMAYAVALDTVGTGNSPGMNVYGPTVTGQIRGAGNSNASFVIGNQQCFLSLQNGNSSPGYCIVQGNGSNGVSLGDGASGRTVTFGSSTIGTTNCQLGGATGTASPAACGAATSGAIAIPASQTSYTVNTTGVTANSEITVQQITDNSGLPSSPTCNSGATTPIQSARVAGTSFTFTLTSVASVTCVKYWIVN